MAMTLHEKGKATLKKKQYGDALYLLLEADKEFKYGRQKRHHMSSCCCMQY